MSFWSVKHCYVITHWLLPSLFWHLSITMMPILRLFFFFFFNCKLLILLCRVMSWKFPLTSQCCLRIWCLHILKSRSVCSRLWHIIEKPESSRERPQSKYTFTFHSALIFSCHDNFGSVPQSSNTSFTWQNSHYILLCAKLGQVM